MSTTTMSPTSNPPSSGSIRLLAAALSVFGLLLITIPISILVGPTIEVKLAPPVADWTVDIVAHEGQDLILAGSLRKTRTCDYQPPPRAVDEFGYNYVIESRNVAKIADWPVLGRPQRFGPWVIPGAAGHEVTVYQEHKCHPLWQVITVLGTYDDRRKP